MYTATPMLLSVDEPPRAPAISLPIHRSASPAASRECIVETPRRHRHRRAAPTIVCRRLGNAIGHQYHLFEQAFIGRLGGDVAVTCRFRRRNTAVLLASSTLYEMPAPIHAYIQLCLYSAEPIIIALGSSLRGAAGAGSPRIDVGTESFRWIRLCASRHAQTMRRCRQFRYITA